MIAIINNFDVVDFTLIKTTIDNSTVDDNLPLLIANTNESNTLLQQALHPLDFEVDWQSRLDDRQLDKLVDEGWIVIDNVFTNKALLALQSESGFIDYREAQLTAGIRASAIRGDKIRWITKDFFAGFYYLKSIDELAAVLNRSLFTGIRHSEAHYTCYPVDFGYQWHSDNPANRNERVISAVFYLNDDWQAEDGGALEVVDNQGSHHKVMPVANRLVVFNSNLQHQVQTAYRQRYSIATWMRRDGLVPFVEDNL